MLNLQSIPYLERKKIKYLIKYRYLIALNGINLHY